MDKQEKRNFWGNLVLFVVMLVGALLFGANAQPAEMGLFIVACAICLAFINIDKIQRFKGAGFEAEMRKAVDDAVATMDNLRSLARPLTLATLDVLTTTGRWGAIDVQRKHDLQSEVEKVAKEMNVFGPEMQASAERFFFVHARDHIAVLPIVLSENHVMIDNEVALQLQSLYNVKDGPLPSVDAVRKVIAPLSDEAKKALEPYIEDYEYYLRERKLRRGNVWKWSR